MKIKFEEPEALSDVAQFHQLFDMPILDKPVFGYGTM